VVDLPGRPATDLRAAMEENLEQAHDARLMDFEAGIADGADSDRVGKAWSKALLEIASAITPGEHLPKAWTIRTPSEAKQSRHRLAHFLRSGSMGLVEGASMHYVFEIEFRPNDWA